MTTYYIVFENDAPQGSGFECLRYEYEVQANTYEQAMTQAQALHGATPYHSTHAYT